MLEFKEKKDGEDLGTEPKDDKKSKNLKQGDVKKLNTFKKADKEDVKSQKE